MHALSSTARYKLKYNHPFPSCHLSFNHLLNENTPAMIVLIPKKAQVTPPRSFQPSPLSPSPTPYSFSMSKQPVVVGYASDVWEQSHGTWYDTHIGGTPVFPPCLEVQVPPCPICFSPRLLVVQAYAPHNRHLHRVIYLYGCNSIQCSRESRTWWAVRACGVKDTDENKEEIKAVTTDDNEKGMKQSIDWDTDSDNESSDSSDLADDLELLSLQVQLAKAEEGDTVKKSADQPSKSAKKAPRATTPSPQPQTVFNTEESTQSKPGQLALRAFHIVVENEPSAPQPSVDNVNVDRLLGKYREEESTLAATGTTEAWVTETDDEQSNDRCHTEAFLERIQRAPGHILRYSYGGEALWPKIPFPQLTCQVCDGCGSKLVFELQILGSCLHYLQAEQSVPQNQNEAGMNFASICVFTCTADCTTNNVLAESVGFKMISQTVCIQHDDW